MAKKRKVNKVKLYRCISDGQYTIEGSGKFCPELWHKLTNIRLYKGQIKYANVTHLQKGFKFEVI